MSNASTPPTITPPMVEVTLPDGSKVSVPASFVAQQTDSRVADAFTAMQASVERDAQAVQALADAGKKPRPLSHVAAEFMAAALSNQALNTLTERRDAVTAAVDWYAKTYPAA